MNFGEDEVLLFRYAASCKAREGEVVVTDVRFMFIYSEGSDHKQFAWASIAGVKYSPPNDPKGRAMVLLKTTMKGEEDIVISLVGSSKDKNFSELENLKGIISTIRKAKASNVPAKSDTRSQELVGSKRGSSQVDAADHKRRRQILEYDRNLSKQYRDLVEVNKILTDEEFWSSYSHQILHSNEVQSGELQIGKQNALLTDVWKKDANGVINVTLTTELKHNIFAIYPEVRRAFEAEVPIKRSETEFWRTYFQSEFYNAKPGTTADVTRDDLFARYANQTETAVKSSTSSKLPTKLQHPDIDLTASFNDYRPAEALDSADMSTAVTAGGANTTGAIAERYNRCSALVLGSSIPTAVSGIPPQESTALKELMREQDPSYIAMHLASNTETDKSDSPHISSSNTQQGGDQSSGASQAQLVLVKLTARLRQSTTRTDTTSTISDTCLPSTERGNKVFISEIARLRKQTALTGGSRAAGTGTDGDTGRTHLPHTAGMAALGFDEDAITGGDLSMKLYGSTENGVDAVLEDSLKQVGMWQ